MNFLSLWIFLLEFINLNSSFSLKAFSPSLFVSTQNKLSHTQINIVPNSNPPISQVEDDGFSISNEGNRISNFFVRGWRKVSRPNPGTLVLVRHGESEWNFNKTFTGWVDVDLSERGCREVEHAGRLLLAGGYTVDVVYTSRLKRAIRTTWILLQELHQAYRPVYKSWRLNERMYGALEGLSKPETARKLGEEEVQAYRAGLNARPPPMKPNHPYWHKSERKYADLHPDEIPVTESLQDTMERTLPLWYSRILPDLQSGRNVLVVAHGNSLRGIVKHIDSIGDEEIANVGIPNGIPLVFKFDRSMKPIVHELAVRPLSGLFLEKKGLLRAALAKEAELAQHVPGYTIPDSNMKPRPIVDPVLRSLAMLDLERQLFKLATGVVPPELVGNNTASTLAAAMVQLPIAATRSADDAELFGKSTRPIVVIIRHGKTEFNKLGLFTGWDDAPLADEGREEARAAGRVLRAHGIEFDVVYTSWLSRAIETAWIIMNELDSLWLPIIKSWRLNERMYGALTGLSKRMIKQKHGEKQFMEWRRGYKNRPPKVSSFSNNYPGNDDRYPKYVKDVRFSLFESLIRSIAHGRLELHRKFPKTESLSDCTKRTIPYYKNVIVPGSIAQNKSVLIASSENAIRGLLMHLCEIPEEHIHELEIPTGIPLVLDVEKKRVQLLDDGLSPDPVERYNFGTAIDYLFRPCDDSTDTSCYISSNGRSFAYDPIIRLPSSVRVVDTPSPSQNYSTVTVDLPDRVLL